MTPPLRLHYAPDNASLCVRLALEALRIPYRTRLVDRGRGAQRTDAYLRLNPNGQIPVLETPDGPMFETAAILLWLDEQAGGLLPPRGDPARGRALSWLFWLSNSLHPSLIALFYRDRFAPAPCIDAVFERSRERTRALLDLAEAESPRWPAALALDVYLCPMLRWLRLYPTDRPAFNSLDLWPRLAQRATLLEATPAAAAAAMAEGLGARPFTRPERPNPPEGSPT